MSESADLTTSSSEPSSGSVEKKRSKPSKRGKRSKGANQRNRAMAAERADKYELYEESVQDPDGDVERVRRMYKRARGRPAKSLREDFCGTGVFACAWVAASTRHEAVALDLDPEPLAWGRNHHYSALRPEQRKRVQLLEANVLQADSGSFDIVVAFNFSYFIFQKREELKRYLCAARSSLSENGLLILDVYGGPEAQECREERREYEDFTYVWDQDRFDPITHGATCLIHFEFPDGSEMRDAFRYRWRLWSIPELRDLIVECGFSETTVYWEGTEKRTNEPNGVYRPRKHAEDDPAWVAYITAKP